MKEIFAGVMGGVSQLIVGQPFDLVKVRMQNAEKRMSSAKVFTNILKNEGPLSFYKGTLSPLMMVGASTAMQFSVNARMQRYWEDRNRENGQDHPNKLAYW